MCGPGQSQCGSFASDLRRTKLGFLWRHHAPGGPAERWHGKSTQRAERQLSLLPDRQPATTDSNGTAMVLASTLPVGQSTVNINFAGDAGFQAAQLGVSVTVLPAPTLLRYTGANLVTALGQQQVSAVLTNSLGTTPVVGRTVTFTLNGISASGVTDIHGSATATLNFTAALNTGAGQLQINFAGDANYRPSSRTAPVQIYQPMPFVVWGANTGGLRIGQRVISGARSGRARSSTACTLELIRPLKAGRGRCGADPAVPAECHTGKPHNGVLAGKAGTELSAEPGTAIVDRGHHLDGHR